MEEEAVHIIMERKQRKRKELGPETTFKGIPQGSPSKPDLLQFLELPKIVPLADHQVFDT
jgi:hypothetical protein